MGSFLIFKEPRSLMKPNKMNQNILFTCAGRRNYLINYFKEALHGKGKIFAADQDPTAPALVDADVAVVLPNINDPRYMTELVDAINAYQITAVISLNDLELPILAANKERFDYTGAKLILSSPEVIDITFDKWKTHQFLIENGLNSPQSFISFDDVKQCLSAGTLKFPLVLKPRWGSASIGIHFAEDLEELDLIYRLQLLQIHRTNPSFDKDHAIIIQEKLNGIEYGLDVLNDFEAHYVGSFGREKLSMRSGETDKAMSVIIPELSNIGRILGENLKHIGTMDCDVFKCKDKFYVLELNPRFGGGYPFSHEAGINTPAIYIDWLNKSENIEHHLNYVDGIEFSKCDRLLKAASKR